ncbi:MAG: SEC-C domain-containing protein [Nanoarchaeota archaeon]|nr:SEC-C domain-containing protein [Nanoarchaeota archaeon]
MEIPLSELKILENLTEEIFQSELQKDFLKGKVKIGRNEKCFCGSGLKYKKCCLNRRKNEN